MLSLMDVDKIIEELDKAIKDLGMKCITIQTNINGIMIIHKLLGGNRFAGLMCTYALFRAEKMMTGSFYTFDPQIIG